MPDLDSAAKLGVPSLTLSDMLPGLETSERDLLTRLGIAVVALWSELPRNTQRLLFEGASAAGIDHDEHVREKIARFLHDNGHPDDNADRAPGIA